MTHVPANKNRLFRLSLRTVECFGVVLVVVYWLLVITGVRWGDKFHYCYLFHVSIPVMVMVGAGGLLSWGRSRNHSFVSFAVVLAWVVWAALPRI